MKFNGEKRKAKNKVYIKEISYEQVNVLQSVWERNQISLSAGSGGVVGGGVGVGVWWRAVVVVSALWRCWSISHSDVGALTPARGRSVGWAVVIVGVSGLCGWGNCVVVVAWAAILIAHVRSTVGVSLSRGIGSSGGISSSSLVVLSGESSNLVGHSGLESGGIGSGQSGGNDSGLEHLFFV